MEKFDYSRFRYLAFVGGLIGASLACSINPHMPKWLKIALALVTIVNVIVLFRDKQKKEAKGQNYFVDYDGGEGQNADPF